MKNLSRKQVVSHLVMALGVCAAGLAQADTTYTYTYDYNWTVNNCTNNWYASCGLTGSQTGSSVDPSPAPADPNPVPANIGATATGWANTSGSASPSINQPLQQGQVQAWGGGLGVKNAETSGDSGEGSNPEHAVDNNDRYDSILYEFGKAISLTEVSLSWWSNDSDITVMAYTDDAPFGGLAGLTYAQLLTSGWEVIGHYYNVGSMPGDKVDISADTQGIFSSYWLIGAANNIDGNLAKDYSTCGSCGYKSDYVKVAGLGGIYQTTHTPPGVPEPGSLALLGLGVLLMTRVRGRLSA